MSKSLWFSSVEERKFNYRRWILVVYFKTEENERYGGIRTKEQQKEYLT